MARKTIGTRKLTDAERSQRSLEIGNDITQRLNEARKEINWARRRKAEKSLMAWFSTYCVGVFADTKPDGHLPDALGEMESAIGDSRPYMICMARGHGKTTLSEGAAAYSFATGKRKYIIVIGANLDGAKTILDDIFRLITSEPFATDYPDVSVPVVAANGSFRRRITYGGVATDMEKNATRFVAPTVVGDDGEPVPTSGSIIVAAGFGAGIRGKKRGSIRPDMAFMDDIQTDETAANPEQVKKQLQIIRKSVLNLGGKKKIACLMTATVIEPDDLAVQIRNDKAWKTSFFKAFQKWPSDWTRDPKNGLWAQYFALYDSENNREASHAKSLAFYRKHKREMDAGSDVLSPMNFKRDDGHISAVQKLMDKMHEIKLSAFSAEFQMTPSGGDFALELKPKDVISKASDASKLEVPDGYTFVSASTDLNLSYALTTTITAFRPDTSATVIFHERYPSNIDGKLTGREYYDAVYALLSKYASRMKSLGVKVDAWGLDCNGTPFEPVTDFAKACFSSFGIRARAMRGSASHKYNPNARSRLANDTNRTMKVGDAREQVKAGAGRRWIAFDSDHFRELVQRSLLAKHGAAGGCELYVDKTQEREEYAVQVCNEKLVVKREHPDGRTEYRWKSFEPHDYLDAMGMNYALAAHYGIASAPAVKRRRSPNIYRASSLL